MNFAFKNTNELENFLTLETVLAVNLTFHVIILNKICLYKIKIHTTIVVSKILNIRNKRTTLILCRG